MRGLLVILILVTLLVPAASHAQFQPNSWVGIANVNYNVATFKDYGSSINGLGFGLMFERVLGGKGAVSVGLTANYFKVDGTVTERVQAEVGSEAVTVAAEAKGVPMALYARYMFGGPGILGYIGAGPGAFIGESTLQKPDEPAMNQSTTKFAGFAMAGGFFKMGNTVWLNAGVSLYLIPDSELFTDNSWGGFLGLVFPIGNP
jgi:hypothetical protein